MNDYKVSVREVRRQFRNKLIKNTLVHATEKVEAYRDLCAPLIDKVSSIEKLSILPITRKEQVIGNENRYRDNSLKTIAVQHTGGTSGKPLTLHRSAEEFAFIERFFDEIIRQEKFCQVSYQDLSKHFCQDKTLCISLFERLHGEPTTTPFPGRMFDLNNYDNNLDINQLISDPTSFLGENINTTILSGFECQIRLLTCRLIELNYDFRHSKVAAIFSTGDYLTSRLEKWYQKIWGVPIVSKYGLTEIFGGALRCLECNHWHFEPHVIGEVVDAGSFKPIDEGHGVLVVTCLHPFVQKQPVIRYWTGDLVALGPTDCSIDSLGFRFVGRLLTCKMDSDNDVQRPLLMSALIYDILDDYPDVASSEFFIEHQGVKDHSALGSLKFAIDKSISGNKVKLCLHVETRYSAYMYIERSAHLVDEITERILTSHPHLFRRINEGLVDFQVELAKPGTLRKLMVAQIE